MRKLALVPVLVLALGGCNDTPTQISPLEGPQAGLAVPVPTCSDSPVLAQIDLLKERVGELRIPADQKALLLGLLEEAKEAVLAGENQVAVDHLREFQTAVEALKVANAVKEALIAAAECIITALS